MDQQDKDLINEVKTSLVEELERHEDQNAEHIERHVSRHLTGVCDLLIEYEKHSRRRSWILSVFTGLLVLTNLALVGLILGGGIECLSWYGEF